MARRILILLLALLPCLGLAATPDHLFSLINQRLGLMQGVATSKWHNHLPIEDAAREKVVLDSAATAALRHGLKPESTRAFFNAQIEAAKTIEHYWFDKYRAGMNPGPAPDLRKIIRPQLIDLGNRITQTLADLPNGVSPLWQQRFLDAVNVEGLKESDKLAIFKALTFVKHFANRLQQIRETGELRVGTTGDYAPFSLATGSGYSGIDIDMANDLAKALGVRLVIVKTSWPHLIDDLAAGRYDIAMSGVSRNTSRENVGFFSLPYYEGGKAAIARCADAKKYSSLKDIDKAGVRVIVNPGGTNEKYVKQEIHHATVIVFDDNTKIFDELVNRHADVMVTDAIEVKLQALRHKSLCATMPGKTLTYLDKAYLMPQDPVLKTYVDNWLDLRIKEGVVAKAFAAHLK